MHGERPKPGKELFKGGLVDRLGGEARQINSTLVLAAGRAHHVVLTKDPAGADGARIQGAPVSTRGAATIPVAAAATTTAAAAAVAATATGHTTAAAAITTAIGAIWPTAHPVQWPGRPVPAERPCS